MGLKPTLVKGIREQQQFNEEQAELKEKYNIKKEEVIVVEKSNMIKFFVRTGIRLFHFVFTLLLILLAIIGLVSLVYPETRSALWVTAINIYHEFIALF